MINISLAFRKKLENSFMEKKKVLFRKCPWTFAIGKTKKQKNDPSPGAFFPKKKKTTRKDGDGFPRLGFPGRPPRIPRSKSSPAPAIKGRLGAVGAVELGWVG